MIVIDNIKKLNKFLIDYDLAFTGDLFDDGDLNRPLLDIEEVEKEYNVNLDWLKK